jgi:hypothetical protein
MAALAIRRGEIQHAKVCPERALAVDLGARIPEEAMSDQRDRGRCAITENMMLTPTTAASHAGLLSSFERLARPHR